MTNTTPAAALDVPAMLARAESLRAEIRTMLDQVDRLSETVVNTSKRAEELIRQYSV